MGSYRARVGHAKEIDIQSASVGFVGNPIAFLWTTLPPPVTGDSDTAPYVDPVAGVILLGGRTTVIALNDAQLAAAIAAAVPGRTIQLGAGAFNNNYSIAHNFPANNPLIIKGAGGFGSVLNGNLTFGGARNIVTGIDLSGANVRIVIGGINNKVIGCRVHGWGSVTTKSAVACTMAAGTFGEFAYNEIYSPGPWMPTTTTDQLRIGIRTAEGNSANNFHYDAWVHHCYFHDFPTKPIPGNYGSGQSDAIEVGQNAQNAFMHGIIAGWYIEYCLVSAHLGNDAIVDYKVGGITTRYCTWSGNPGGRWDQRAGQQSVFESNWMDTSGGADVHGPLHRYIGNNVSPINILAGNVDCNAVAPQVTHHRRACQAFVSGNSGVLNVGKAYAGFAQLPALNTAVEDHTPPGSVNLMANQTGTIDNRNQASSVNFIAPVKLTPANVGPAAITNATAAYKAARGL